MNHKGVLVNIVLIYFLTKTLELNTPGFFYFEKERNMIDYTKLNDRIIEQAYSNILSPEQKLKLIEGKFERAAQYYKSVQAPIYPNKD